MKRIFTFGLMLAGAFALTNCAEELIDPTTMPEETTQETATPENEGIPFKVYATLDNSAETKTVGVKDDTTLKTKWDRNDKIHVYCQELGGQITYFGEYDFPEDASEEEIAQGLFTGSRPTSFKENLTYNWYFVYGGSGHADNNTTVTINIPDNQTQSAENDPTHIGGINCPMWGKAEKISGSVDPRVQMKHLATLHEITITNANEDESPTAISVTNLGMTVSSAGTWISKHGGKQQPLAGLFGVDILTGEIKAQPGNTKYDVKLKLTTTSEISKGGSSTYYIVTAPLTIQTEPETDPDFYQLISDPNTVVDKYAYNGYSDADKALYEQAVKRQDVFNFTVNRAARAVPANRTYNMESGEVYRFTLPVRKMRRPVTNNAVGQFVTISASSIDLDVNGSNISGWSFTEGNSLKLVGTVPALLNALDAGFYASSWNDAPTAMTISKMQIYFGETPLYKYKPLTNVLTSEIKDDLGWMSWLSSAAVSLVMGTIEEGINRDKNSSVDFLTLTQFIHPATITFTGLISNGVNRPEEGADPSQILILDEEPYHKSISKQVLDSFIGQRFVSNGKTATAQGLIDIANNTTSEAATNTSYVLYNTFKSTFAQMGVMTKSLESLSITVTINMLNVFNALAKDEAAFQDLMRSMKVELEIVPCTYFSNVAYYGDKAAPVSIKDMKTNKNGVLNPIVFWGFDVYGPNSPY
jgi:hypothetical protein